MVCAWAVRSLRFAVCGLALVVSGMLWFLALQSDGTYMTYMTYMDLYGAGSELQTACRWDELPLVPILGGDDLQPSRCNLKLDRRGAGYIAVQL